MTGRSSCAGCLTRAVLALFFVSVGAVGFAFLSIARPYEGFSKPVTIDFPKGTSTRAMAQQLADAGVIRQAWMFLAARALRPQARLLAGEYQFSGPASALTVFDRIARGDIFFYELTVPEGSNMFDIAASLSRFDFLKSADFLRVAHDPKLISDLSPRAPTLEGYLFPSTYRIERTTTVEQLCRMMTDQFRKRWQDLSQGHAADVNAVVTLASLVEKETAVARERPIVASVYANRLRIGMPLDCDPTTIYAALLDERYRGTIYRSDLDSENPYNTYRHAGLPPGPIANPGVDALKAALEPAETKYIYFVAKADGSGGHQFSETIADHEAAVQKYRRATQKPQAGPVRGKRERHRART